MGSLPGGKRMAKCGSGRARRSEWHNEAFSGKFMDLLAQPRVPELPAAPHRRRAPPRRLHNPPPPGRGSTGAGQRHSQGIAGDGA